MRISRGLASGYGNGIRQFLAVYLAHFGVDLWQWGQCSDHGCGGLGRHCHLRIFHYHHGVTGQSREIGRAKLAELGEKPSFDCDRPGSGQ